MRRLLPVTLPALLVVAACAPDAPPRLPDPECVAAVAAARLVDARLNRIDAEQHALMLEWMKRLQHPVGAHAGARARVR